MINFLKRLLRIKSPSKEFMKGWVWSDKKTKSIFIAIISCSLLCTLLTGCETYNYDMYDMQYGFDYAWILLPNGEVVEGKVEAWRDYEDGDQIQVTINGIVYLTDTTRCVLRADNKY